jgi:hypothetical protein
MRVALLATVVSGALGCGHRNDIRLIPAPCLRTNVCAVPMQGIDTTLPPGTIRGLVVDSTNGKRVQAQVSVSSAGLGVFKWTDKAGRFMIQGLRPGPDTLIVRMIGYRAEAIPVTFPASSGIWMIVPLPWAQMTVQ